MNAEVVFVSLLVGSFLGFIIWIAVHTRRHWTNQGTGGHRTNLAAGEEPDEARRLEEQPQGKRKESSPGPS